MSKDDFKQIDIVDQDVEVIYRRKTSKPTEEIHGFNPMLVFVIMVLCIVGIVITGQNNHSTPNQTIIVK